MNDKTLNAKFRNIETLTERMMEDIEIARKQRERALQALNDVHVASTRAESWILNIEQELHENNS